MESFATERAEPAHIPLSASQVIRQVRDHAMFLLDREGRIASWNEGVQAILGWNERDWLGQPVRVAFTPEDAAAGVAEAELRRAAETGRADDDRWMQHHSGRRFFAVGAVTRLVDSEDRLVGFLKVLRDFTAHQQAQAEGARLLISEHDARGEAEKQAATLTAAIDAIPDGFSLAMADGVILRHNAAVPAMLGVPAGQTLPRDMDEMVHKFRFRHQRDGPLVNTQAMPFARALGGEIAAAEFWATRLDSGADVFLRSVAAPVVVDSQAVGAVSVTTDLSERLHLQQQGHELSRVSNVLRERDEELRALVHGVRNYAIFTVGVDGLISSWHVGARLMKGYSAEEAIGMPFENLFTAQERADGLPQKELEIAARTGEYKGEGTRVRRDGSRFEAAVVLTALRGPQGELLGYLKLTQDISERKHLERDRQTMLHEARAARAEAERAHHAMSDFLATISHELRTPLSAILGWARVLEKGPPDANRLGQGVAAISRNAQAQVQLIEDLLDMNRIECGQLRLNMQAVELGGVVAAAVETALPKAAANGIELRTHSQQPAVFVSGDPDRLQQIVDNLLDNAVKFTPSGGTVTVSLCMVGQAAEMRVADTGQGIHPAFLGRVFERFQQQDSTLTRRHGGLGIGLAVVRELVRLHGGSERAESEGAGRGATFTVTLPLLSDSSGVERRQPANDAVRVDGITVLLVDDEPDVRATAAHLLRDAGANVLSASNAVDGLRILQEQRPQVVLSDIGMPGNDGYELMRWVRALPDAQMRRTPAAAFTAYAAAEDRQRALMAGYQLHLVKPVHPNDLVAAVAELAQCRR
ncbi:MAG: PAS domain S-box protein [Pseudomonadota bacterium]